MINPDHHPIVIIACKVFQDYIEKFLSPDRSAAIQFLEYGLHSLPRNLKKSLQEQIDQIEQPSLVVLGYGLCGNGLHGIRAGRHTLLLPRTDDCIALLLGSYTAYREQFDFKPGTYYLSKGWLEAGSNPLQEHQKYIERYGVEQADWLMEQQYKNYKRLVFVASTQEEMEQYRPQALEVARFCQRWGMEYEELLGSSQYVEGLMRVAQGFQAADSNFLVIPPGETINQSQYIR